MACALFGPLPDFAFALTDHDYDHIYFDISWDKVAKYVVATPEVAPTSPEKYHAVFEKYQPLWRALTPEASEKVRKGNCERLFDAARLKVRAWEKAHAS